MIALALLRFLARTPWSTAMALIGMALGVTSIVSVHLVSSSVSSRLDGLVPGPLAEYSHYLHRDKLNCGLLHIASLVAGRRLALPLSNYRHWWMRPPPWKGKAFGSWVLTYWQTRHVTSTKTAQSSSRGTAPGSMRV